MDLSIKGQLKKHGARFAKASQGKHAVPYHRLDSWMRRDILVVTNKTEDIVRLFGDYVVVLSENEYVPPIMKIGKVYAAANVSLSNRAWWDDLRLRSVDKAINLL